MTHTSQQEEQEQQRSGGRRSFLLGSTSIIKIEALLGAMQELGIEGDVFPVAGALSGVSEQPCGNEEMMEGAFNRVLSAHSLRKEKDGIYVSMENGINVEPDVLPTTWYDSTLIMIFIPSKGLIRYAESERVIFPTEEVFETYCKEGSFRRNTVGQTLFEKRMVDSSTDPHKTLCGKSRVEILKTTATELLRSLEDLL